MTAAEIDLKKQQAKTLFLTSKMSQKDIAELVSISEKTMSLWVNEEHWDTLKDEITQSDPETLRLLYKRRRALAEDENTDNADSIAKLTTAITAIEKKMSIGQVAVLFTELLTFTQSYDVELAKQIARATDNFIKSKM